MSTTARKRIWVLIRRVFCWFRIGLLLLLLSLLCAFIYVNRIGVPEFIKAPIVAELRERGLELEFRRMRVRWYRGIVAEDVVISRSDHNRGPQLDVREAEIRLDPDALRHLHFKVAAVQMREGQVIWPLVSPNQPVRQFRLEKAATELRFLAGDRWELDHFNAVCQGVKLNLTGVITNASAFRGLSTGYRSDAAAKQASAKFEERLREFVETMERLQFPQPPEINLKLRGDAKSGGLDADLKCEAPSPRTPWGSADHLALTAQFSQPPGTNGEFRADLLLRLTGPRTEWAHAGEAEVRSNWSIPQTNPQTATVSWAAMVSDLKSDWGGTKRLNIAGESTRTVADPDALVTRLDASIEDLELEWLKGASVGLTASFGASITNLSVTHATWNAAIAQPRTPWGTARQAHLKCNLVRREANSAQVAAGPLKRWAALEPYDLDLECDCESIKTAAVAADTLHFAAGWRSPVLRLGSLTSHLYGGDLDLSGFLNTQTRRVESSGKFDFDVREIAPFLEAGGRHWLNDNTWSVPPKVKFQASTTLPAWTNAHPDWVREMQPATVAAAEITAGTGAYRGIGYDSAIILATLSNQVFELPRVVIHRPEGTGELSGSTDLATGNFHLRINSQLDPNLAVTLIDDPEQREVFKLFQFSRPPEIQGDLWGRLGAPEVLGAQGRLALSNFRFRGEAFSNVVTSIAYTNQLIRLEDLEIQRDELQKITTALATLDLTNQRLWFTNAHSTLDPLVVRLISPEAVAAIKPYHFQQPPKVNLYGAISLNEIATTDLHFEIVEGGPFDWLAFNLPQVVGNVNWVTNHLIITNVDASFYGGRITGDAVFFWPHGNDADYHFHLDVKDANLNRMLSDLSSPTNKLEGTINGILTITAANTGDIHSWNGYGTAQLKDGLLWNFPLYGVFSPILNAFAPGLGNSRAKQGTATYIITNSVIRTDDLEIRSPPVVLHYDGTVDFDKVVKAKVVADPIVGPFSPFGKMFAKIFEYKVSGTLEKPKSEPVFIPKLFLVPFHPIQSFKNLVQPQEEPTKAPVPVPEPEKKP